MGEVVAIDHVSGDEWAAHCGGNDHGFASEAEYTDWIADNIDVLKQVVGLTGSGIVRYNQGVKVDSGRYVRPDISMATDTATYLFEVKLSMPDKKGHGCTKQVAGVGQVMLYGAAVVGDTKLFIVDANISPELIAVVREYKLPITLIEANRDYFSICWHQVI